MSTAESSNLAEIVAELQSRVRALEDVDALRNLKAEYAAACDDNYDPDRLAALFVEDATWESEGMGRPRGAGGDTRVLSRHIRPLRLRSTLRAEPADRSRRRHRPRQVVPVHALHRGRHRQGHVAGGPRRRGIRPGQMANGCIRARSRPPSSTRPSRKAGQNSSSSRSHRGPIALLLCRRATSRVYRDRLVRLSHPALSLLTGQSNLSVSSR